jgi:energy-coupling factor transport system permease protein
LRGRERVGWIPRIKYLARASPLDRLDPIAKLAMLVGGTVLVFVLQQTWQLALVLATLIVLFPVARVRLWEMRAALRFFLVFSILLMVIHALFVHAGEVLWQASLGPVTITVTWGGLLLGLHMVIRFLVVVLGSFLFVATTEPNRLAHSLMRAGLPYKAGFALVLALRLMPLMRSESNSVREAQAARGLALDRGGPRAVITSVRSTVGPLLVSSLSRVDALVISMEGRAFGRSRERTFLREARWSPSDSALLVMAVLLPLAAVLQRWFI